MYVTNNTYKANEKNSLAFRNVHKNLEFSIILRFVCY